MGPRTARSVTGRTLDDRIANAPFVRRARHRYANA